MIGLLDFIEDVPRFQVAVVEEMRRTAETRDPVEALYGVKEPGSPADLKVEARIAVDENIEPGALLLAQVARHRVEVLFAVLRVAHCDHEGTPVEVLVEQ